MSSSKKHMDHMLLPKATLMRFINQTNKKISVLNFFSPDSGSIKEYSPRSFHTKNNYYNKTIDEKVKVYETKIGEWNKLISESIKENDFSRINFDELKRFAIKIITLQFNRFVLVDEELKSQFYIHKESEYNKISLSYFRNGVCMPSDFNKFVVDFRKQRANFNDFFQKNYLMNDNSAIEEMYAKFHAVILIIPEDMEASFLLPPQHYVAFESTARVILAPKLAIGLYPESCSTNVIMLTKNDVDALVPRSIESALAMSDKSFRQVVGEKNYLTQIISKIDEYRNLFQCIDSEGVYRIRTNNEMLQESLLECIIMLKAIYPNTKKVILILPHDTKDTDKDALEWSRKFIEYGYEVTVSSE